MQSTDRALRLYRVLALVGGSLILLVGIIRRLDGGQDHNDPLWARLLVVSAYYVAFAASFGVRRVREHPQWVIYFITYSVTPWVVWLMYLNDFNVQSSIGFVTILFVSCLLYTHAAMLIGYVCTVAVLVVFAVQVSATEVVTTPFMLAILFSTGVMSYLILKYRLRTETNLSERDALLGVVFDGVSDGIVLIDTATHAVVRHNPSALALFGARTPEALGRFLQPVVPGTPAGADGTARPYPLRRATGQAFWGDVVVRYIEQSDHTYYLIRITDVTERKQHEDALEAAKNAAEAADQAKSDFLATMSHEIRTPMNGVIGMTSLLAHTPLSDAQRDYVDTIRTSGDTLLTIINDILDFSKIEANQVGLEKHPFNVYRCIEDAFSVVAQHAAAKHLNTAYTVGPGVPAWLTGDVTRLRQVLVNLLGNATKFTEAGEIVVDVALADAQTHALHPTLILPEAMVALHVTVRDTGIGIPESQVATLFDAFTQADASTTRKYGGTGLGLTICHRLVTLMGGEIWVDSTPGAGSSFHFTVVLQRPAPDELAAVTPHFEFAGQRILLVDAYTTSRRVVADVLTRHGLIVHGVADAERAMAWLESAPDCEALILTQHVHTSSDGVLALQFQYAYPDALVLLLTPAGQVIAPPLQGAARVLAQPVHLYQLLEQLATRWIGPQRTHTATYASEDVTLAATFTALPVHILLAEDNQINQKVATRMFRRLGMDVDVVANGLEVLAALEQKPYDIIFMDIMMPELDGIGATRRIRSTHEGPQPWIVAVTANVLAGDREHCLDAGMDDYVAKPISLDMLTRALERWQSSQQQAMVET